MMASSSSSLSASLSEVTSSVLSSTAPTTIVSSSKRRESLSQSQSSSSLSSSSSSSSSELLLKQGYLFKCAKLGSKYWSKKYFILKGLSLTYYNDHNTLFQLKGELLLTNGTIICNKDIDGMKYCFIIKTLLLEEILIACKNNDERIAWKQAINDSINNYNCNILKCSINIITLSNKYKTIGLKKYFKFNKDTLLLQQYSDKDNNIPESSFMFNKDTTIDVLFKYKRLTLTNKDNDTKDVISIQFNKNEEQEFILWHDCFTTIIEANRELPSFELEESNILKSGVLSMRSNTGEWPQVELLLTNNYIIIRDIHENVLEWYAVTADIFVYETTFSAFSFEIVTVKKIIHFSAANDDELSSWSNIFKCYDNARNDYEDSIVRYALKKCKRDSYYEMTISDSKPLGIVLEKSGVDSWAIIKSVSSKDHESKLKPSSALAAVNGENTMFLKYTEVMDRLKAWTPPLTLTFRIARDKKGLLKKRSVAQNSGATSYSWKTKYCIMTEGKLIFKDDDSMSAKQRGEVQLMGASVQLMSFRESGQFYCFRINSGVMSLVLAASSLNDMIDWVANIHHVICICNGGGHIRRYEIDRQLREERQKAVVLDTNTDSWETEEEEEEEEEECLDEEDAKAAAHIAPPVMPVMPVMPPQIEKRQSTIATPNTVHTEIDDSLPQTPIMQPPNELDQEYIMLEARHQNEPEEENLEVYEEEKEEDYVIVNDVNDVSDVNDVNDDNELTADDLNDVNDSDGRVIFVDNENAVDEDIDYDEVEDDEIESGTLSSMNENNKTEALATSEDLQKIYAFYSKNGIEGMKDSRYINVMTFSAIFRIVSGEKGNLFQEMQIFNKFDKKREGYMVESDFVNGFLSLANDKSLKESDKGKKYLVKFRKMLGEKGDNLLI